MRFEKKLSGGDNHDETANLGNVSLYVYDYGESSIEGWRMV